MNSNIEYDWLSRGNHLFSLNNFSQASEYFEKALKKNPNTKFILLDIGNNLFE